ncbi:hypothetical protein EXIGLDRAFT_732507 [Exidia glandulosa HHB12029]|uniref:Uncharacterized protein n=1 Tax=Exidia glandulosa HHB12029 TaxID=1314781 RepID=A0A166B054_EXIGL|nr:hypothetical protein EXIGLDRAFT_732507 [Exidia glandulosa HHB12029]
MASPPSPPLAPWSPSAPQYFGENPNAFAPPPLPSPPPPQTQTQVWVPQPHPQPAGGLGPSVVFNNSPNNHDQDVVMQHGYAPQHAYAYPQPVRRHSESWSRPSVLTAGTQTESISAWEYAYIPEVVQPNYTGQAQSSFPMGSQQVYAGPESNYPHQHSTGSVLAQPHVQPTPHAFQSASQSQSSVLQQNYAHHCESGCPEHASSSNADNIMSSNSFPAATMVTNPVPELAHGDGSAKKAPKRTSKPKRQTKSRSKKAVTNANQATTTAPEIATPSVCPPGTVDPKDVFSNPNAGRVARPRAAAVRRRQAKAGASLVCLLDDS